MKDSEPTQKMDLFGLNASGIPNFVKFILVSQKLATDSLLGYVTDIKPFLGLFHMFVLKGITKADMGYIGYIDYFSGCVCEVPDRHLQLRQLAMFVRIGNLFISFVPPKIKNPFKI